MAVVDDGRNGSAVEVQFADVAIAEVEQERGRGVGQVEADFLGGFCGGRVWDERVTEAVVEIGDAGGPLLGESAGMPSGMAAEFVSAKAVVVMRTARDRRAAGRITRDGLGEKFLSCGGAAAGTACTIRESRGSPPWRTRLLRAK